ncbi:hypothetical protein J5X84_00185 [Streptosporangiaceae bacterium NEAU-GS5]|nr:hypothetical protein [Streptosporangiaceae bacterium NEAU-GS5]
MEAPAAQLPAWTAGYEELVPDSLSDLHGPAIGVVPLPVSLAWSGTTEFDLSKRSQRLLMYNIVITTGGRADFEAYLNADVLVADWPILRRGLGPGYRRGWEKFSALTGPR